MHSKERNKVSAIPSSQLTFFKPVDRTPPIQVQRRDVNWIEITGKLAIGTASILVLVLAWMNNSHVEAVRILLHNTPGRIYATILGVYGISSTIWSFWRLWLAMRYKPTPTVSRDRLPKITVVVPAYNEGPLVGRTIRHLAKADYPEDRIEIIVVDDGSEDDTWKHIQEAAAEVGSRVKILHFAENRGKRHVLYEGFKRGTGEIFITVDSDSLIAPDALPALVSPMVVDPTVGGVAGNVTVLNRDESIIPQMLTVRYVMTFDYKRAAQSMMGRGAVLCCAGALAAYRRSAIEPVLDQWLHQTWLGGKARAGEDHAMTNLILKQGHNVRYQRSARVWTKSPTTYQALCKMFLRWARSNVRETAHTWSYVFGKFHGGNANGIRFNFIMSALGMWLPYPLLAAALVLSVFMPSIFGLKLLAMCVTGASFSMLFYLARERSVHAIFAIVYGFYATLLLCWVWPYALMTSHKSIWMTRSKNKASPSNRPMRMGESVLNTPVFTQQPSFAGQLVFAKQAGFNPQPAFTTQPAFAVGAPRPQVAIGSPMPSMSGPVFADAKE